MGLDDLRAELLADTSVNGKAMQCRLCLWLVQQPQDVQDDWDAVLEDRSYSHTSISRALDRRGTGIPHSSVENHRLRRHRQQRAA